MSKLDKIMAVVCRECGNGQWESDEECSRRRHECNCMVGSEISAILAEPDVIEVEGITWTPIIKEWHSGMTGNGYWAMIDKYDEEFLWNVIYKGSVLQRKGTWGKTPDLDSALSAATAALKEER